MTLYLKKRSILTLIAAACGCILVLTGLHFTPAAATRARAEATTAKVPQKTALKLVLPATTSEKKAAGSTQDPFFAEFKLQNDRAMSLLMDMLNNIAQNPLSSSDERQKAQDEILKLSRENAQAVELEGLIKAQGYKEAVVFFTSQGVTTVVEASTLTADASYNLVTVIARQAGVQPSQVTVIARHL